MAAVSSTQSTAKEMVPASEYLSSQFPGVFEYFVPSHQLCFSLKDGQMIVEAPVLKERNVCVYKSEIVGKDPARNTFCKQFAT